MPGPGPASYPGYQVPVQGQQPGDPGQLQARGPPPATQGQDQGAGPAFNMAGLAGALPGGGQAPPALQAAPHPGYMMSPPQHQPMYAAPPPQQMMAQPPMQQQPQQQQQQQQPGHQPEAPSASLISFD